MAVVSFAQNTRDEVRYVNGDGQIAGALAAEPGMKQTNYVMRIDNKRTTTSGSGIDCLCPHQPQTHRVYGIDGVMPSVMANTGKAGQDQAAILKQEIHNKTTKKEQQMKAEVRRLTTTEVTRLQGMPDDHPFIHGKETSDSSVYSLQGNGWARNCSRLVFKKIHEVDERHCGRRRKFKIGSVSSGQGTHEMSVLDFGDESVFCADIAPFPCEVLATRFPNVPNFGDVTRVSYDPGKQVLHNRKKDGYALMSEDQLGFKPVDAETFEVPIQYGEMDCISGGLPCTSVSVAGKRHGAAEGSGTRSALAYELPRIGKECGAKWLVYENVPGLASSNGGTDLAWFLYRLQQAGYSVAWRIFDAQFVRGDLHPRAVPQRRRRIWLVAYRGSDWRVPCEALFEPIKALGTEPPKRTVGIGFLKKVIEPKESGPRRSELEEFEAFVAGAKPGILELLEKKGICESVSARRRELEAQERKIQSQDVDDLFGLGGDLFGEPEETHQGRGLKASDLELNLPRCADIRSIPQYELYNWAKTVSSEICYMGDLFGKNDGGEPTVDDLQPRMLENIGNAGFLCDGLVCTMKMPEWNAGVTAEELATMPTELAELYDGDVCGLSDILEPNPDPKYKLSWRACYGILHRASKRGKMLPIELGYALVDRMIEQAAYVKWCAENGRDTKKKETDLTEREIAKIAFNDFIEVECHWVDVAAVNPTKDYDPVTEEVAEEIICDGDEESDDPEADADGDVE